MQQYWINQQGKQQGPFSLEELQSMPLDASTYVWFSGMTDWKKIGDVESLAHLVSQSPEAPSEPLAPQAEVVPPAYVEPARAEVQPPHYAEAQPPQYVAPAKAQPEMSPCPPTNLVWAILCTLLCCTPLGVVAIVMSAMVRSSYNAGDYDKAQRLSDRSAWWCIASIVLGIIAMPFAFLSLL